MITCFSSTQLAHNLHQPQPPATNWYHSAPRSSAAMLCWYLRGTEFDMPHRNSIEHSNLEPLQLRQLEPHKNSIEPLQLGQLEPHNFLHAHSNSKSICQPQLGALYTQLLHIMHHPTSAWKIVMITHKHVNFHKAPHCFSYAKKMCRT